MDEIPNELFQKEHLKHPPIHKYLTISKRYIAHRTHNKIEQHRHNVKLCVIQKFQLHISIVRCQRNRIHQRAFIKSVLGFSEHFQKGKRFCSFV